MLEPRYRVTRFCCRSGMCFDCHAVGNLARRKRIVHDPSATKALAEKMMVGWAEFDPKMEPTNPVIVKEDR